jgi:AcrR family transcriptional regulator
MGSVCVEGEKVKSRDRKLGEILKVAAEVIARDGYEKASVRAVAREAKTGLSSLYYYFRCKEEMLFLIQFRTFDSLVGSLKKRLVLLTDPKEKLAALVRNHLDHFLKNMSELKVCSRELESLNGEYYRKVEKIRREYFKIAFQLVSEIERKHGRSGLDVWISTTCLFGMLNWIYMWYDPRKGISERRLSEQLVKLFLNGFLPRRGTTDKHR